MDELRNLEIELQKKLLKDPNNLDLRNQLREVSKKYCKTYIELENDKSENDRR